MKKIFWLLPLLALIACDSGSDSSADDYNREAMLTNWADNIIIPAYENYVSDLTAMVSATETFVTTPSEFNLQNLRATWQEAYLAWQWVSMFEIGEAELLRLQGKTNTYPSNTSEIDAIIASGVYDLDLPSRRDQQGFPALDYLINGMADSDAVTVAIFANANHQTFLSDLVGRLHELSNQVLSNWNSSYRDEFVQNNGSSATAAVNKLTNDYIFYYEKYVRASKIGVPAGVFAAPKDENSVEAYYQNDISKQLFEEALTASQNFFNGKHYGNTTSGESFSSYLDYLKSGNGGEDLTKKVNDQFETSKNTATNLSDSFAEQVVTDNTLMLNTYDALQEIVILLKVDMMLALDIRVDYVDADGD